MSSTASKSAAPARRTLTADSVQEISVGGLQQRIEVVQQRIAEANAELAQLFQQLGHAQWLHEYETTEAARSPSRR